jgi:hypothetical protein
MTARVRSKVKSHRVLPMPNANVVKTLTLLFVISRRQPTPALSSNKRPHTATFLLFFPFGGKGTRANVKMA